MNESIPADTQPRAEELEEGKTYAWCACGRSAKQPYCDGAHKETSLSPNVFKAESSETVYFCMCKQTKTPPYCDGSHNSL